MNIWDIVKKVGSSVVKNVIPGGGLIVDIVNEFLPDDSKLPNDATGDSIKSAVESLPPEQKARLMEREFDVQIEEHHTVQTMLEAEQKSVHTTRPKIALGSFRVVSFVVIMTISIWSYAIIIKDAVLVKSVTEGWPFVLSVVAPLVSLLWAYFGILRKEQSDRLSAISGNEKGLASLIGKIFRK